jgi:glycosyltransferase 2 family protein
MISKRLIPRRFWFWFLLPVLLWWIWRDVPFERVFLLLGRLSIWQILALIGLNSGLTLLFSIRWWLILRMLGQPVPYWKLVIYRVAGFSISFLTPGPQFGGEPLQIFALHKLQHVPASVSSTSVVLDKSLELLANFTFLSVGVGVAFFSGLVTTSSFEFIGIATLGMTLMPAIYILFLIKGRKPITGLLRITCKLAPGKSGLQRLSDTIDQAEGLAGWFWVSRRALFLAIFIFSLLVWVFVIYEYWLSFSYLGLDLSLAEIFFIMTAARLALLLPLPGGLGALEASQVLAVSALGLNPAYGIGIMLLARCRDFILVSIGVLSAIFIIHPSRKNEFLVDESLLKTRQN